LGSVAFSQLKVLELVPRCWVLVERQCNAADVRRCVDELRRREATLSLATDESDDSPTG